MSPVSLSRALAAIVISLSIAAGPAHADGPKFWEVICDEHGITPEALAGGDEVLTLSRALSRKELADYRGDTVVVNGATSAVVWQVRVDLAEGSRSREWVTADVTRGVRVRMRGGVLEVQASGQGTLSLSVDGGRPIALSAQKGR